MKFWKIFLLISIPYAILTLLFKAVIGDLTIYKLPGVLIASVCFGAITTLMMQWFVKYQMKRIVVALEADETLVREGGANRILNLEGVGGKLVLTNKRLIFKSHKLNIQAHQLSLPLAGISSVEAAKTGFLSNVLLVYGSNDERYKFIVFEPGDWVNALEPKIATA